MKDEAKTKEQLISELAQMRQRLVELEVSKTKLNRAEQEIKRARDEYLGIANLTGDIIVKVDREGKWTFVNDVACKFWGKPRHELIETAFVDYLHPDDQEKTMAVFEEVKSKKLVRGIVNRQNTVKGWRTIEWNGCVIIDEEGRYTGLQATGRDITERKQAEEALRESEEMLHLMCMSLAEGITVTDLAGNIVYVNEAVVRLHSYNSKQELIGLHTLDLIAKKDHARAMENMKRTLDEGCVRDIEYTFLSKDGHEFQTELSAAFLKNASGNPQGFITVTRDISKRKETDAELLVYQKELRSLASQLSLAEERERRRIAIALHDRIGQTLAVCRMRLGALVESAPPDHFAQPLSEINTLINQIIKETRSLTFEVSSPLLYELGLEAALERLTEQFQEQHGILFSFEDDEQPKPLDDDLIVLLFQTVRELLVNVTKHAQARYTRVCIKRDDNNIRITVEDDGIGLDTSRTSSSRERTNGFGLFSIKERMHHTGGHIEIESKRGHGTLVTIVAPLKRE